MFSCVASFVQVTRVITLWFGDAIFSGEEKHKTRLRFLGFFKTVQFYIAYIGQKIRTSKFEMFRVDCPLELNSLGWIFIYRIFWANLLFQFIPLPLLWNNIKVKLLQILLPNVGKQTQPKTQIQALKTTKRDRICN